MRYWGKDQIDYKVMVMRQRMQGIHNQCKIFNQWMAKRLIWSCIYGRGKEEWMVINNECKISVIEGINRWGKDQINHEPWNRWLTRGSNRSCIYRISNEGCTICAETFDKK